MKEERKGRVKSKERKREVISFENSFSLTPASWSLRVSEARVMVSSPVFAAHLPLSLSLTSSYIYIYI